MTQVNERNEHTQVEIQISGSSKHKSSFLTTAAPVLGTTRERQSNDLLEDW